MDSTHMLEFVDSNLTSLTQISSNSHTRYTDNYQDGLIIGDSHYQHSNYLTPLPISTNDSYATSDSRFDSLVSEAYSLMTDNYDNFILDLCPIYTKLGSSQLHSPGDCAKINCENPDGGVHLHNIPSSSKATHESMYNPHAQPPHCEHIWDDFGDPAESFWLCKEELSTTSGINATEPRRLAAIFINFDFSRKPVLFNLYDYLLESVSYRGTESEVYSISDGESLETFETRLEVFPPKRKVGRPAKTDKKLKRLEKRTVRVWEFVRDLLKNPDYCPSLVRWENPDEGQFCFVDSEKVAKLWGQIKGNPCMNYEKLSRAMRYYYKRHVFEPVLGRRLVYKFGCNAVNWRPIDPNFVQKL